VKAGLPDGIRARLDPSSRFGLRLTLAGIAIVLVAVPFSTLLFAVVAKGPIVRLDGRVADDLNGWVRNRYWAVHVLRGISFLGGPPMLDAIVAVAAIVMWRRGRPRLVAFLIVAPLGGGIVDSLVKLAVARPRPIVHHPVASAVGKSFPSGHAMSSTVTYGAMLVVFLPLVAPAFRRAALVLVVVLVLAIGASRLLLGVHFVSDVVGGYVLGVAWLAGAVAAFETWRVDEGRRRSEPLSEGIEPEASVDGR
jgi:undecaprenyl-diphosphatase